jgi:hypothetical protein
VKEVEGKWVKKRRREEKMVEGKERRVEDRH